MTYRIMLLVELTKPEEVEQREKEGGGSLGRERTERKRESCK